MRIVVAVQLKRDITSAGVFSIVIGEFSYWKEPYLVVLFKVDKSSKVSFYDTILPLDLTVYLKLEHG